MSVHAGPASLLAGLAQLYVFFSDKILPPHTSLTVPLRGGLQIW